MSSRSENTITEVTRRAIIDYLSIGPQWSGNLPEDDFLGRLYDLKRMRSTDYRAEFDNAAKDIWKHRVVNSDWPDSWVFTDERFDLLFGLDESFLKFLAETVHPVVRSDASECEAMVREYNSLLGVDGWEIYPVREISRRPVFGYRQLSDSARPHLDEVAGVAKRITGHYVGQQARRLRDAIDTDPELAIGTAKEFLETLCKSILTERGHTADTNRMDLPVLVKTTVKSLNVLPKEIATSSHSERAVSGLLTSLGSVGHQLAELRNQFGTGHGRGAQHVSLEKRHAKLVVGAAISVAVFLYECHEAEAGGYS